MSRLSFASFPFVRVRTAVFGLTAVMLLSGCQGGSAPGGSPSETSSTTASPTSSVSVPAASTTPPAPAVYKPADAAGKAQNVPVPVMPELAKENSKEGLEAFIGYWYATYSYATETGDLEPWSQSTDLTTESGVAYKKAIEVNYADGRWLVGGRISIPSIEVLWQNGADSQVAKIQVIQEEILYFDANARVSQQASEASNTAEAVKVTFKSGNWHVIDNGLILG
ncbi:DUF6318 family protein [Paenarthrobacter nitroguajacolicus]|uniref:DUF6318 family protein n=1 Tax=Paenarthrobacter nitroguajacolicus TaxID=211146 RepID=UPI003ADCAEB4